MRLYIKFSGFFFLLVACLGVCRLHQHDRPKSSGKLDEGSNGRNQKTMGHTNGTGNGVSGPVRGKGFKFNVFRCKTVNKTHRRTNNECSSRFLPKCTKDQFSCLPGYCFLPFFFSILLT